MAQQFAHICRVERILDTTSLVLTGPGISGLGAGENVYVLAEVHKTFGKTWPLVLVDSDRDGVIDTHNTLDSSSYQAAGFTDPTAYIEYKNLDSD